MKFPNSRLPRITFQWKHVSMIEQVSWITITSTSMVVLSTAVSIPDPLTKYWVSSVAPEYFWCPSVSFKKVLELPAGLSCRRQYWTKQYKDRAIDLLKGRETGPFHSKAPFTLRPLFTPKAPFTLRFSLLCHHLKAPSPKGPITPKAMSPQGLVTPRPYHLKAMSPPGPITPKLRYSKTPRPSCPKAPSKPY